MLTLWIQFKDGTEKFIDCKQVTYGPTGNLVIMFDGEVGYEKILGNTIDHFGVWKKEK